MRADETAPARRAPGADAGEGATIVGVICGPTTGCGRLIPYQRDASGRRATPEHCPHCGKWCGVMLLGAAGPMLPVVPAPDVVVMGPLYDAARLAVALERAAEVFDAYAQIEEAKATPVGYSNAAANRRHAADCRAALAAASGRR